MMDLLYIAFLKDKCLRIVWFCLQFLLSFVTMKTHLQVNHKDIFKMGEGTIHLYTDKRVLFLPV